MDVRCLCKVALFAVVLLSSLAANAVAQESPTSAIQRAITAYGAAITADETFISVSEGTITFFSVAGPKDTFPFTVTRKGPMQIQRIIKQSGGQLRQGSDGNKAWSSVGGAFSQAARGSTLEYIESQTVRSVPTLLSSILTKAPVLRDSGKAGNAKVIEAEDADGRKTSYFIDDKTSLITRMEFQVGDAKDIAGRPIPATDVYVFSDFRAVQQRITPFKIERYTNGLKMEEMQFSSVTYNAAVPAETFRP